MREKTAAPYPVYIGLGANVGHRAENIRAALALLDEAKGIHVARVSSLYETPPWGDVAQPPFLNAAAMLTAALPPPALLAVCQRIEQTLGRVRTVRWGPRCIDIDLLHVPGFTCQTATLTLPHPYLTARAFVVVPLSEIAPTLVISGRCVTAWAASAAGAGEVLRWTGADAEASGTS